MSLSCWGISICVRPCVRCRLELHWGLMSQLAFEWPMRLWLISPVPPDVRKKHIPPDVRKKHIPPAPVVHVSESNSSKNVAYKTGQSAHVPALPYGEDFLTEIPWLEAPCCRVLANIKNASPKQHFQKILPSQIWLIILIPTLFYNLLCWKGQFTLQPCPRRRFVRKKKEICYYPQKFKMKNLYRIFCLSKKEVFRKMPV